MNLKAYWGKLLTAAKGLIRQTVPVLKKTAGVTLPCAALLWAAYMLETACAAGNPGAVPLMRLLVSLAATPVAAGMITYAAGASWEGRSAALADAYHLARIRIKEIAVTGLAAGAAVWLANALASVLHALIGIVPALLGWIPAIGPAITAAVAIVFWLISTAVEFFALTALALGMLSLTADGMTGRAQAERALNILRSGREDSLYGLGSVFLGWIAVQAVCALLGLAQIMLLADALSAVLTAAAMTAVSVVYLKERDRQDGMRYHV